MGYTVSIYKFNKKTLEEARKLLPHYNFSVQYDMYISSRLFPVYYEFPKEEIGKEILCLDSDVLHELFLNKDAGAWNTSPLLLQPETWWELSNLVFEKLKESTLLDVVNGNISERTAATLITALKDIRKEKVDFRNEFLVADES